MPDDLIPPGPYVCPHQPGAEPCNCRSCQMERISNLAGLDADGAILPPGPDFGGIDREAKEWWKP